jgi:hypothetical protein
MKLKHALLTGRAVDYFHPKSSFFTALNQEQQSLVLAVIRQLRPKVEEMLSLSANDAVGVSDKLYRYVRANSDLASNLLTYVVRGLMRVTGHQAEIDSVYASRRKRAYGYMNYEWQGNDALLFGPDKKTILLSGKAARDFQNELERLEEEIPHDEALEPAVNELITRYFEASPTQ